MNESDLQKPVPPHQPDNPINREGKGKGRMMKRNDVNPVKIPAILLYPVICECVVYACSAAAFGGEIRVGCMSARTMG